MLRSNCTIRELRSSLVLLRVELYEVRSTEYCSYVGKFRIVDVIVVMHWFQASEVRVS